MLPLRRTEIALFLLAIVARILFFKLTSFTADDAFITFRYALNFGAGEGFVYNAGEHVLGTSTPFFAFLLSTFSLVGVHPPLAALAVSVIASGATAILLYRLAGSLRFTRLASLPALAYIFWPRSIPADSCGMETALFTFLVTASFYFQHRRLPVYALGTATLAFLTRPEGGWLLILLLGQNLYSDRSRWMQYLFTPAMLLIPWAIAATWYFGSPIPNSIYGKLALYSHFGQMSLWDKFVMVMGWNTPLGWLLWPGLAVGVWWLRKTQNYGVLPLLWITGMATFFIIVPPKLFFWYVPPIYPIALLLASASAVALVDRVTWIRMRARTLKVYVLTVSAVLLAIACYRPYSSFRNLQHLQESVHKRIGQYLAGRGGKNDVVAAEDIGYIGYYSRLRIIDRDGLISPEVLPYNRSGAYEQVVLDFHPDWVVLCLGSPISDFATDPSFTQEYRLADTFAASGTEYRVFQKLSSR